MNTTEKNHEDCVMCSDNCECHNGARYDQIECSCPWWCGYKKDEVPNWEQLNKEHIELIKWRKL